jgi:hypothetical protein
VAAHLIESGRDAQSQSWTENPALQALDEIESGRDKFQEIDVEEEEEVVVFEEEVTPKKRQSKKAEKALTE